MANSNLSISQTGDSGIIISSLADIGLKVIIEAIFIFGGSVLYFFEVVERYLVFPEIKSLYLFTGIWIIASSILFEEIKKRDYPSIRRELLLFWAIFLIFIFISVSFTYQKLDSLSINPWRFFGNYASFIIINTIIAFAVHWLYELTKEKLTKKGEMSEKGID